MKKIITSIAFIAAVISCTQKEITPSNENLSGEKQIITARVNVATKVAYTENNPGGGAGISSVWQDGDSFYAIQDGSTVVSFTLTSGAGTQDAIFTAETTGATESTTWKAVLGGAAEVQASEIHCGYMGQNGTIEGLGNYNYVAAEGTGMEPVFNFDKGEKLSYVLRIKLPAGIKTIEYTPCGWTKVATDKNDRIYFNSGDQSDYSAGYTSTITLDEPSEAGELVYISLPLLNYSRTEGSYANNEQYGNLKAGVIITILNNTSNDADASNGCVFEDNLTDKGGKIGTIDLTAMTLVKRPKPSEAVLFEKTGDIQCKLHSSALTQRASTVQTWWAPYNLGATSESEVGDYYAWGEYKAKTTYTFPSYTLRHSTKSTNRNDLLSVEFKINGTKYGYSIAGSRYDVARIKWGIAWRLPHMIEVYAASNGQISRDQVSGVDGVRFTNGGNSIFIPNSRYMDGETLNNENSSMAKNYSSDNYDCARFWSADQLNRSYNNAGWNEAFTFGNTSETSTGYDYWRRVTYLGFPVRAVLSKSVLN